MVDRYSLEAFGDRDDMWPRNDGQWVRYFDCAAEITSLSAKLAEAERERDRLTDELILVRGNEEAAEARVAELEKALTALDPIMEARQKRAELLHEHIFQSRELLLSQLSPEAPAWLREAFDKLHAAHHILGGDPFDMHARAALSATKEPSDG